nr:MAG TPA: hypothetical protein [Caudoviricetes sp.]
MKTITITPLQIPQGGGGRGSNHNTTPGYPASAP